MTAQKGADGQPQSPSFHWTDPLRGLLHDLMRAFEAWATKALRCGFSQYFYLSYLLPFSHVNRSPEACLYPHGTKKLQVVLFRRVKPRSILLRSTARKELS